MVKRLVVFDLDGTLAESKGPLDAEMATLLGRLLEIVKVAVISGGAWRQFERQVLAHLSDHDRLGNLFLLPTNGTKFFRRNRSWKQLYSEDFKPEEKHKIIEGLKAALDRSGVTTGRHWGEVIEDRGSQITFSALGQQAPLDARRIAPVIEENPGQANARVVATPDQAREKIEAAVLGTDDCRIEHALDLIRISRLRLHQHPETGELERGHATFSPSRQAMTVSMTRLVSSGSRTLIDATPTCFAG